MNLSDLILGDMPKGDDGAALGMFGEPDGDYEDSLVEEGVIPCGYIPQDLLDDDDLAISEQCSRSINDFVLSSRGATPMGRKVALYEARRSVRRRITGRPNDEAIWIRQVTGSCVGASGGTCVLTLQDVEIALGGELQESKPIWWLYAYGEGREKAGMRSRGSGSFGSAQAWAVSNKGNLPSGLDGLPQLRVQRGWYQLDRETELEWSDGDRRGADQWDSIAGDFLVRTVSRIRSADSGAESIINGYPMTAASRFGTRGTRIKGEGDNRVRIADWDARWAHQMLVDGWWDHPILGELFHIMNQWGPRHGKPEDGSPYGGFWVTKRTFESMCRHGEVYSYSNYEGHPGRPELHRLAPYILGDLSNRALVA